MSYNYIVSAQKPTVVTHAVVGCFVEPDSLSLVLAKTNRVELLLITPDGLKPFREVPVFGRIVCIKAFRGENEDMDSLLVLTAKYHLAIISWNANGDLRTRAAGCIADRVGRPSETGVIACVSSSGLMAFRLYDGLLKIVQWSEGRDLRCFNLRCEDLFIIDLEFLLDCSTPTIVYIYQDQNGHHLKALKIKMAAKELDFPLWRQDNIDSEAFMLIPVPAPFGGVVVIGQESISYHKDVNMFSAIAPPLIHQSQINCYARVDKDGQRFLLGDLSGRIFMLLLDLSTDTDAGPCVKDLKIKLLGEASIPECLVYLDNGVVFLGSRFGDSQLIRLTTEPCEDDLSYIYVMDSYTNLAPIRDMVVISQDGQQQVVTCSGAFKDGSLRVIRNGIGIEELASVELPGIKSLFPLKVDSEFDDYLVVGFVDETHVFKFTGEEMEDTQLLGVVMDEATLWVGDFPSGAIAQVTPTKVILTFEGKVTVWDAPARISVVSVNQLGAQAVIACDLRLIYLKFGTDVEVVNSVTCDHEISCLDISPIGKKTEAEICAVGYWTDLSVGIRLLPDLKEVVKEKVGGEMLARSVLIACFEENVYLLVALGDGVLHYFRIDHSGVLLEPKKATLGTQPTILKRFASRGMQSVFACSDRPAVIYCSNQKLVFSNVNLKLVAQMCQLNSAAYPSCLVLSDGQTLVIGKIDDIQKLHIRTVPLGESVSRVAYQRETNTIAVLVQRNEFVDSKGSPQSRKCASKVAASVSNSSTSPAPRSPDNATDEIEVSSVLVLDATSFEVLHAHELGKSELGMSLASCTLGDDPQPYYAVGTAILQSDEAESKAGRVIIFQAAPASEGGRLRLVHEKEIKGAAYSIRSLMGKLVVSINSCVRLYEWTNDKELQLECSNFDNVTALFLCTKNDRVLVGDLMRSLSVLSYKSMESSFETVAKDIVTHWMSACEFIDSDSFIGAENSFNLFSLTKESSQNNKEDVGHLQEIGLFYLGEMVNIFCHGSLVASHVDASPPYSTPILYGTSDGGIGVIVQLSESFHTFLHGLESRMSAATQNCMRIDHSAYRSFETEKRTISPVGFIDGDLIESLLDMGTDQIQRLIEGLKLPASNGQENVAATVEEALKVVEELARIH